MVGDSHTSNHNLHSRVEGLHVCWRCISSLVLQHWNYKWFYAADFKGVLLRMVFEVMDSQVRRSILYLSKELGFYPVNSRHICRLEAGSDFPLRNIILVGRAGLEAGKPDRWFWEWR